MVRFVNLKKAIVLTALLLVIASTLAFCADIVTVPTANQLKKGQIDLAYYYIGLDMPESGPQNVNVQTFYVGLSDKLELDLHRYDVDKLGTGTILNATWCIMRESAVTPDLVIGGRNITGEEVGAVPGSDKKSWFIAGAKTLNLPVGGPPKLPIIRLHAGLGTRDHTLLGEDRHDGLFGGVQILLAPQVGAVVLHDAQDVITGLTFTPANSRLTFKGGTFGDHWWVGISYAK